MIRIQRRQGEQVCTIDSLQISVLDITPTKVTLAFRDRSRSAKTSAWSALLADLCCNRGGHFWFSSAGVASLVLTCKLGGELQLVEDGRLAIERIVRGTSTIVFRDASPVRPGAIALLPDSRRSRLHEDRLPRLSPIACPEFANTNFWGRLAAGLATLFVRM